MAELDIIPRIERSDSDLCDQELILHHQGKELGIPISGVQTDEVEFDLLRAQRDDVPDRVDFGRVIRMAEIPIAEAFLPQATGYNYLRLHPTFRDPPEDDWSVIGWEIDDSATPMDGTEIWRHSDKSIRNLAAMLEDDSVSVTQALDTWVMSFSDTNPDLDWQEARDYSLETMSNLDWT